MFCCRLFAGLTSFVSDQVYFIFIVSCASLWSAVLKYNMYFVTVLCYCYMLLDYTFTSVTFYVHCVSNVDSNSDFVVSLLGDNSTCQ